MAAMRSTFLTILLATSSASSVAVTANPVRKVVTLLQKMEVAVKAEGEKEKDLFDKFMCYCKTGTGDLTTSISAAETKISTLTADTASASSAKDSTESVLAQSRRQLAAHPSRIFEDGTGGPAAQTAALRPSPVDCDRDLEAGLPWGSNCWVEDLGRPPCVVDAAPAAEPAPGAREAACLRPQTLELRLPREARPGELVVAEGPHGTVEVEPPADHKPGTKVRLRLGAPPELRIQVPEDGKPGDRLQVIRADRVRIAARVPEGTKGGDFFKVAVPAVVVAVPEGAKTGELVTFRVPPPEGKGKGEWMQARCPSELLYGRYFAACMPLTAGKQQR
ncbi:unnamed protein product [Prorocentrum cordatum]|uniref:Uncharacterized protein n=1 Tax=Prorocentrum cordatum TaxID=2364126 RepID=A0ABN9U2G1_9DINO|nr:unnamed protein product [Polarella glacialis]